MSESLLDLNNTAIVLDSTCDAPEGFFDRDGLYVVPLRVHFGDESFRDTVDLGHHEFFEKLESSEVLPTTSQPTDGEFAAVYEQARQRYEHVFSLHLSRKMSGTYEAADRAAKGFDGVVVYDTKLVSTAVSLLAERLRTRLERGCTMSEATAFIEHFSANGQLLIHAATLEYLRRGGRIGRAASLVGGVFDIKPLIYCADGELLPYAKVRGQKKALAAIERFLDEHSAPGDEVHFALIDALNEAEVVLIREMVERVRPNARFAFRGRVGAVVGTHIGPGTTAFAMIVE
jgi:DegV family protein with EDD domain